jgi:DNA recombination protein RmuC
MDILNEILSFQVQQVIAVFLALLAVVLLLVLLRRSKPMDMSPFINLMQDLSKELGRIERAIMDDISRNRAEYSQAARDQREELAGLLTRFGEGGFTRSAEMASEQKERMEDFASRTDRLVQSTETRLTEIRETASQSAMGLRKEIQDSIKVLSDSMNSQASQQNKVQTDMLNSFAARIDVMSKNLAERMEDFASRTDKLVQATELRLVEIREITSQASLDLRKEILGSMKSLSEGLNSQAALQSKNQCDQLDSFATRIDAFSKSLAERVDGLTQATEQRLESIRDVIAQSSKGLREETVNNLKVITANVSEMHKGNDVRFEAMRSALENQLKIILDSTTTKTDKMRQERTENAKIGRAELANGLKGFGDSLDTSIKNLTESNQQKMEGLRAVVETRLTRMQEDNASKLELIRKTVDEQLHGTLEKRLGESFKLVSDRLEQVHKGLGEMQSLATGVGDLKRVLTNVKTRGTWGEVQLERLLEQIFSPSQFYKNVITKDGSREQVEFAVRIAGRSENDSEMLLPIDSKCPVEDYERLIAALDVNDMALADQSSKQLEIRLKSCAKDIRDKYINPPKTTAYGVMFLPSEGLYAEALRRPGLVEVLQRDFKVVVAGPTTLAAILSSVQMGIAINQITKRSTEVWKILGRSKSSFENMGNPWIRLREA